MEPKKIRAYRIVRPALCCALVLAGCGITLYTPTELNVDKRTPATLAELHDGRKLYGRSCSGCHGLYAPERYDSTEWRKQMNEMQERSKISDHEKELIYKYLVNF